MNRVLYACLISFFFWCLLHLLPVKASTNYVSIDKADAQLFASAGVFKNPEFIQDAYGWTIEGCTSIPSTFETSIFPFTSRSIKINCLSETLKLKQCTDKFTDLEAYINAYGSVLIDDSLGNKVFWRVTNGTDTLYESEVLNDNKLHFFSSPLLFAQDNLCIEIVSDGDITGAVQTTQNNIEVNKNTSLIGVFADSTGWEDKGPITITATTTNPTKGATTVDRVLCRRNGSNMEIKYDYIQSSAGAIGSGIYLLEIPSTCAGSSGLTIDENSSIFVTSTGNPTSGFQTLAGKINGYFKQSSSSVSFTGYPVAYDSTHIRFIGKTSLIGTASEVGLFNMSSSHYRPFDLANGSFSADVTVPIKQWRLGTTAVTQQVDFDNLDNHIIYSAYIDTNSSITQGLPWISSCSKSGTNNSNTICNFSSVFTSTPVCVAAKVNSGTAAGSALDLNYLNSSSISFRTWNTISLENRPVYLICIKNSDDDLIKAFKRIAAAQLLESNIKKDVEQFPTTEQKLCDACYKGKALYRKCAEGSISDGYVLASGVTDFFNVTGWYQYAADRRINIPANNGVTWAYVELNPTNNNLLVKKQATTLTQVCAEYTKD